jgi:hypothetical protein
MLAAQARQIAITILNRLLDFLQPAVHERTGMTTVQKLS